MANRKSIPEATKLRLWTEAGGRCQFKGCNKRLWEHDISLSDGNFAEMAHIIGASEQGPRGNKRSQLLQTEIENLMLLCAGCHKTVDGDPRKYTVELLKDWKRHHEERIEIQTSITSEIHQSTIVVFTAKIGDRPPQIHDAATYNAIFPRYPSSKRAFRIEFPSFDRNNPAEWESAKAEIEKRIRTLQQDGYDGKTVSHLSVFGIGPMPLLKFLGKCIGDTIPVDTYQAHRTISDTNQTWTWAKEPAELPIFTEEKKRKDNAAKVALLLSISDKITEEKLPPEVVDEDWAVYEIALPAPSPRAVRHPSHLESFSKAYRQLLNQIQERNGVRAEVHLFPAVPVSIAIECGRVLLPTKDPTIWVHEFFPAQGGFRKAIRLL